MRSPLSFALLASVAITWPVQAQMIASYTGGTDDPTAAAPFQAMTQVLGHAPTGALTYIDSSMQMSDFVRSAQYAASTFKGTSWSANLTPVVGLPMAGAGQNGDEAFKSIASGAQDSMINGALKAFSDAGLEAFYLRPGWEMNGGWYSWSVNNSNAADFVAAFQHIATLAHNYKDAIVSVVFNPNVGPSIPLASYYPGNKFVDVIGLDTYGTPVNNDGSPSDPGSDTDISLISLATFAQANGKPLALPETGSGSADTAFPTALANALISNKMNILFAGLWDVNNQDGQLRWTDNTAASAAWRNVANIIAGSKVVQSSTVFTAQGAGDPASVPDPTTLATETTAADAIVGPPLATPAPQGVPMAPPPAAPDAGSQAVSVTQAGAVYFDSAPVASTIVVTGQGAVVGAFGGPETVTLQAPGTALSTGAYNDTVTVQSFGNSIDLGWGQDTVTLAYPPPVQTVAATVPITDPVAAPLGDTGNRFYLPAPQTGVLTINGTLAAGDQLDLSKALAGTTWDHQTATLGQYVSVGSNSQGATISVGGVVVARIIGRQSTPLTSLLVAS